MTAAAVGIVTIGQSPRTDVVPDMAALLPAGTPVIERGALDDAGPADLARLAPVPGEEVLVSRMRDGTEVALAEARLLPLVQDAVDHVTGRGAAVVAVLCTGTLPRLRCPAPLLLPGPWSGTWSRPRRPVPASAWWCPRPARPSRSAPNGSRWPGPCWCWPPRPTGHPRNWPGRPRPSRRSGPTSWCSTAWASTAP